MKVAIATQGHDVGALVDPRLGRAQWFIVADTESGVWTSHGNQARAGALGGAGALTARAVLAWGVSAVITGHVGPTAHKALSAREVTVFRAGNGVTAHQAIEALMRGELSRADTPTVAGHWA
jgi:predicted Fe-Mo cluster-binding NifX family protein